jgi:hypothetical protein
MDTNLIVESLTEQRDRVIAAIAALTGGRTPSGSSSLPRKRGKMSATGKNAL